MLPSLQSRLRQGNLELRLGNRKINVSDVLDPMDESLVELLSTG